MVANMNADSGGFRVAIAKAMDELEGEFTYDDVLLAAVKLMTPEELVASTYSSQIALVEKIVKAKGRPPITANKSLWPEGYLDSLINLGDGGHIHIRDAEWSHHLTQRDHDILNNRRVAAAFEIKEQRRDILAPVMEGTSMTTAEALKKLDT